MQVFVGLKVDPDLKAEIKDVADRFFGGNISDFLRLAITTHLGFYQESAMMEDDPEYRRYWLGDDE